MSIDTRAKRDSALLDPWGLPIPDGTLDASDRLWMLGLYSGIAAEELEPAVPDNSRVWLAPRKSTAFLAPRKSTVFKAQG